MRSQITFVMHPDDECEFVRAVLAEPGTVFVDGPSWATPEPPITSDIQNASDYLIIWNPAETPPLVGKHYRNTDREWWYCQNEFLTIQFLRSGFQFGEPFLFEGRIASCTTDPSGSLFHAPSAAAIERRFKALKKFIKKTYTNSVIIWQNTSLLRSKMNPLKLASSLWVGPSAMKWLNEDAKK